MDYLELVAILESDAFPAVPLHNFAVVFDGDEAGLDLVGLEIAEEGDWGLDFTSFSVYEEGSHGINYQWTAPKRSLTICMVTPSNRSRRKGWRSSLGVAPLISWDMSSPVMALRVMPRR